MHDLVQVGSLCKYCPFPWPDWGTPTPPTLVKRQPHEYQTKKGAARDGWPQRPDSQRAPKAPTFPIPLLASFLHPVKFRQQFPLHHPRPPRPSIRPLLVAVLYACHKKETKKQVRRFCPLLVRGTNKKFTGFQGTWTEASRTRSGAAATEISPEKYNSESRLGRVSSIHRSLRVYRCQALLRNLVRGKGRGAFLDRR
jgi:hypothetical protein